MPPSGELLKQIMESQQLRALYIPPAIAEQLLQEPGSLDLFKKLDFLCYTGAPFSPSAGKQLVEVTTLVSLYGSTEAFQVPQLVPSKEDWSYMEWNPNFKLEMQPSEDEEGAYEVVLFTDASTERTSALNHNVPGVNVWRTKDLFKPHPTKPTLWRYFGRRDDIIVLSNSEKFNPVPFELAVQGHPLLAGALVVGQGRVRASLLVEPKPTVQGEERASLIDAIWPRVEEANHLVPGHGRISRSNIIVAEKPFTRAGKGTVVRKLTEQTFKPDIEALYVNGIVTNQRKEPVLRATYEWQAVLDFVRSSIVSSFPPAAEIGEDEDLFSFGLDSLNITDLVSRLKAGIEGHPGFSDLSWITPAAVYHHPTIQQFSIVLSDFLNKRNVPTEEARDARATRLQQLLKSSTQDFPKPREHHSSESVSGITVALTGSTGSLGTSILASLLKNSSVTRIILLNRSTDAKQRQESSLKCHGITELDSSRVEFKTINLGHPKLGLSSEDYALLADSIDIFVHNAWRVDFNMSLQSFANPYLQSVRSAIDLSTASKKNARIVFVSSTSSMMAFGYRIPESVPEGFSGPTGLGYAESKSIAEKILAAANDASGTPVTILRVGQVAGSTDPKASAWPTQEWLYPVIKACRALSLVPETLMPIDWVPIDLASSTITELLLSSVKDSLQVYNIVNPKEASWDVLVEELQSRFGPGLKTVPLKEWLQQVRKHESYAAEAPRLEPALKLVDQILKGTGPVSIDTEKAVAASSTLANIKAIDKNLLGIWLDQWKL
jgi:thioester reductase-like protein